MQCENSSEEVKELRRIAQEAHNMAAILQANTDNNDKLMENLANEFKESKNYFVGKELFSEKVGNIEWKLAIVIKILLGVTGALLLEFLSVITYFLFFK